MKSFILAVSCLVLVSHLSFGQADVAAARAMGAGQTVTITGIVTNGTELGAIRYFQDGTGGLAAYGSSLSAVKRGDEVTFTGKLKDYNGLLEIDPVSSHTVKSSGNSVTPKVITISEIGESLEAQLVQINDVTFDKTGTFATGQNYDFTSAGKTGEIRVNTGSPLDGKVIPNTAITLIAIVSEYNGTYQLLPRDQSDLQSGLNVSITKVMSQSNTTTTGMDITWSSTIAGSSSYIMYGKTSALELGKLTATGTGTDHTATISGANPADIFHCVAYTINGSDTAKTGVQAFATVSASAGKINVYFNRSVDITKSTGQDAITVNNMADTIAAFINRAKATLDICVYNCDNSTIVMALNNAAARGVVVRYVTEQGTLNSGLTNLSSSIKVQKGTSTGLMHNKFISKDAFATDQNDSWVLTGSTNWTAGNLGSDFNSVIQIQDASLARTYTMEFEEMWGSNTATPNASLGKFGADKTNNTPHHFKIGGRSVESFFSPSDNTTSAIADALISADTDIEFAVLSFTRSDMSNALMDEFDTGVKVKGMIESINDQSSKFDALVAKIGADNIKAHDQTHDIHHKHAMIDALNPASDPQLVVGSHNWSTSAETKNDENTLIIHDATIVNMYYQEFAKRFIELGGTVDTPSAIFENFSELNYYGVDIFPNPAAGNTTLNFQSKENQNLTLNIYDISGKVVFSHNDNFDHEKGQINILTSQFNPGIYLVEVKSKEGSQLGKLVVF